MVTSFKTDTIEGFRVLKVKFRENCKSSHDVFFKPHSVRSDEICKPADRTLFVANIPPWATAESVKRIFQPNGSIEAVYFQSEPSIGSPPEPSDPLFPSPDDPYRVGHGFKYAYVVFSKPSGQSNCMTKMDLSFVRCCSSLDHPIAVGVKKWCEEYNSLVVKDSVLQGNIDEYMADYDDKVAKEKQEDEELGEADEDGWVTVTKAAKKRPARAKKEAGRVEKRGKKKKKKELKNFYAFQMKDEKLSRIQELRKKFEDDKQKINKMKMERKFRPF